MQKHHIHLPVKETTGNKFCSFRCFADGRSVTSLFNVRAETMNPEASVGSVQARAAAAGKQQLDTTLMESRCRFKMIDYLLLCPLCSSNTNHT